MSEEPASLPPQIPEQAERRNPLGWILLGMILFLLILLQGKSYFTRKPSEPLKDFESRLEFAVASHKIAAETTSSDSLKSILADLDKQRAKNDDAERLWVITTYEAKQSIPQPDLDRLAKSPLKDGVVLDQLYKTPKLTTLKAQTLVKQIEDDNRYSASLAKIHAKEKAGLPSGRSSGTGSGQIAMGLLLVFLTLAGIILWIIFGVLKASNLFPAAGHPVDPITVVQADRLAMRAAQLMSAFIIVPLVLGIVLHGVQKEVLQVIAEAAILLASIWIMRLPIDGEKFSFRRIGFRTTNLARDIAFGIAATVMNYPIIIALGLIGRVVFSGLPQAEHPISVELAGHPSIPLILSLLFSASVVAPIFEETVFRGSFFPALSRVMKSPVWGGVITSILFATIHPTGIPAWPGLAALGAMSCLLAYQTKSLVPSIVMHSLNNAIALVMTVYLGS